MHYVVWRESYIQCNTQRCILTKPCPMIFQFLAWRMKIKELSRRHNLYHFMRYFLLICNYKRPCSKHVILCSVEVANCNKCWITLLKPINFVNSVCTIFIFWKRDTSHQTFPSFSELTSAVILWKQDPAAEVFTQWMDCSFEFCFFHLKKKFRG